MPTFKYYNGSAWVELAPKSEVKKYYNHHIRLTCSIAVLSIDIIASKSDAFTVLQFYTLIATRGGILCPGGMLYDRQGESDCVVMSIEQYVSGRDKYIRVRVSSIDNGSNETYDIPAAALLTTISDTVVPA